LFVYYLLPALVLLALQTVLAQQLEEVQVALSDLPELPGLEVGHFLATDVDDFFEELEHTFPHFGRVLLRCLETVDHAVHDVDVLLHGFDAFVNAGNLR
jgi:hypothetical protein